MPTLDDAVEYIRMGDKEQGRLILEEMLETDENNEDIWLWLCTVVDSDEDREICLENVLAINPDNAVAQRAVEALRAGTFRQNDLLSDLIELDEEEPREEATFLDDFVVADDELALPSTMAKSKPRTKKKSGFSINMRLILLLVLVLVVVLVLGAVAAFSLLGGGDGGDGTTTPGQVDNPPTQQSQEAAPLPTDTPTPTPTPTDTPTPTRTPFQLPTPKPPEVPTPTATRVVSPTPSR
jgi:hypothetical protein